MYEMDKLDMKILSILLDNCREPDRQIGKKIGITGGAVKSRIQRMEKNGVIEKFTLKIEPPVLGYNLFYVVVTGQNQEDVLKQASLVGEPFLVVPCVCGITVCGIVFTLIYDPVKLSGYIPYAIIVGVKENLEEILVNLKKKFSGSFLQKPFLAKNQIVLFMYSDDIFKLDHLTQKVRETKGVVTADLFIPKKITFPTKWVIDAINSSKSSKKLHLLYQTH